MFPFGQELYEKTGQPVWILDLPGLGLWLKADVVNNVFFEKFYKNKLHVSQFMKRINKHPMETIDRLLVRL